VDVRLIVATNEDLLASVQKGDFRQDLYHRLNEFKIQVPPLRERGADLDLFIAHFVRLSNEQLDRRVHGLSQEATNVLHRYDWPGNLRELRNVVKRMVLLAKTDIAGVECLPDDMELSVSLDNQPAAADPGTDLKAIQEANERSLIEKTLREVRYNKSKAARLLNIDRKTLYSKIERYGLD
jgi:two-component system response regulator HydG